MKLPQLSLRDLFWLLLVAAIVSAWVADRMYYVASANRRVLNFGLPQSGTGSSLPIGLPSQ